MKLGAARDQSRAAWRLVTIEVAATAPRSAIGSIAISCGRHDRAKAGICCAPTSSRPRQAVEPYLLLVAVEEAFKNLKGDLAIRPVFTRSRRALRRTSSSPSWPIACTSLLRGACMRWRPG